MAVKNPQSASGNWKQTNKQKKNTMSAETWKDIWADSQTENMQTDVYLFISLSLS